MNAAAATPGPALSGNVALAEVFCCPRCHGTLRPDAESLRCLCGSVYPVIGGIPDLRLAGASWIDYEEDRRTARNLLEKFAGAGPEAIIEHIFAARGGNWTEDRVRWRTRQVLEAPDRLRHEIRGWLQPCFHDDGCVVDLGCGPGMLLAAAAAEGYRGIGIDVSLTWLVAAQRLIAAHDGRPLLAAALAESLPLPSNSVSGVVSLDVVEHVADPAPYLSEIGRVTANGGHVALSTPNRYSLAAEPHVYLWGVGWLPRRWQQPYVSWRRRGERYEYARLLSTFEMRRLMHRLTDFRAEILIPPIPKEEIRAFTPRRRALAQLYNRFVAARIMRWPLLTVGPFYRVIGRKPA